MRLTTLILVTAILQVSASSFGQGITLSEKNAALAKIFNQIRLQTKVDFVFTTSLIKNAVPVSIDVKNEELEVVLKKIFEGQPLAYSIADNSVVVYRKEKSVFDKVLNLVNIKSFKGKVVDEKGSPIPGANVMLKGGGKSVITDTEGRFTIDVATGSTLIVTYVGYKKQEILAQTTDMVVQMVQDIADLDQVQVVGYGTQKKSDLTGSISSIKGSDLATLPTQRVDQALQGRAAGVMVTNTDGAPGGNTTIRIRGMNSINGENSALVVIDGLQGGNISTINPSDVESIEVLKDASATAIYGSKGANGVILVTTKQGKLGKPVISYTYDANVASINNKPDLLSTAEYAREVNTVALAVNGSGQTPVPIFSADEIAGFEKNGGTDWVDAIYRTAVTQNHQLSVSGANDKVNYLVSGGYMDQEGILLNSGYKRFSLRANVKTVITNWATFALAWSGTKENAYSPAFGGATDWPNNPVGAAMRFSPTIPIYDADGNYSKSALTYGVPTLWNPVASAVEPFFDNGKIQNNINAFLDFKLLEGLTLRVTGGARITNMNNLGFLNLKTFSGAQLNGSGSVINNSNSYYQNSNILTYNKNFKKHRLNFTGVAEQVFEQNYSSTINANDFLIQATGVNDLAGANIKTIRSNADKRVVNSYLGRINYNYDDRYLVTASYRADGSSVFGKNNKWGYFPSVSLAWRVAQERFIKELNLFSDLKFRASWGITGSQAIRPYQTLARINSGGNYPYNGSDATDLGFFVSAAPNSSLKWESTTQTNFGMDLGLFKGRLIVTIDYYNKKTTDLLMMRELPTYTGLKSIIDNVGSMGNKGFEFAISGDPFNGDFSWNTGFNISANRTTVLDLGAIDKMGFASGGSGQGTNLPFMYLVKGERFGQMLGWGYEGVWSVDQADAAKRYGQIPGDPHYTDINDDGKIDLTDIKVIGNSMPKFIFGFNNKMAYKSFELLFQIQGTKGNNLFNVSRIALESPGGTSKALLNRWTPENQHSDIPALIDQKTRQEAGLVNRVSFPVGDSNRFSRWIEDASYVRLKNVTFAYNLPKEFASKIKLSNVRVYVSATNLVTLTKYKGNDPEVSSFTSNDAQMGSDYNNYPQSKIFNFGLTASF